MENAGNRPDQNGKKNKVIDLPDMAECKQEEGTGAGVDDSISNAQLNYDMRKIREAVENSPDIRDEKVALLKKMIASGEYKVNSREVAEKMIKEFLADDPLKR